MEATTEVRPPLVQVLVHVEDLPLRPVELVEEDRCLALVSTPRIAARFYDVDTTRAEKTTVGPHTVCLASPRRAP